MITRELQATLSSAVEEAINRRHEYVTLEHLLFALLSDRRAREVISHCGGDLDALRRELESYLTEQLEARDAGAGDELPEQTMMFQRVLQYALLQAEGSGQKEIDGGHILASLFQAERSYAVYLLKRQGIRRLDVLNYIAHGISKFEETPMHMPGGNLEGEEAEDAQEARDPLAAFTVNLIERAAGMQIESPGLLIE